MGGKPGKELNITHGWGGGGGSLRGYGKTLQYFLLGLIREAKDTHLVVHQGAVLSARFAPSLFMHG
jgi:hypothetical protein